MFDLGLERVDQLTILGEDCQVEVVVVVGYEDLSVGVDADSDGVVGDALASDLSQEDALVVEDLDAVGSVITDEDFLFVVHHNAVGELEVLGAAELLEDVAHVVKDDDAHHFALHNDDPTLVINGDATGCWRMLAPNLRTNSPLLL